MKNIIYSGIILFSCILFFIPPFLIGYNIGKSNGRMENRQEKLITGIAPNIFKYAHKYHGILHSKWSEERRRFIFERNGTECLLFTKSFWDWYLIQHYEK